MERNILLTPGPVTTTESVKKAMTKPDIWTRHHSFIKIMDSIRNDLLKIVKGDNQYTCLLFASSGTGIMEGMITSVHPNQRVLIVTNGMYGERFVEIADKYGIDYYHLKFDWGEPIDLSKVGLCIDSGMFSHIFVTHHETSTGILNPIEQIGKMVRDNDLIYCVDTISSFAGIPISVKDCGIDFMVGTSVKCIQGPAGISFLICRKHRLDEIKKHQKSYYFNFYDQYKYLEEKGQSRFTIPVKVMYGLRQALDEFFEEKIRNLRYQQNHHRIKEGMNNKGFKSYLPENVTRSRLLEMFYFIDHPNFDFNIFRDKLYEKGYTIYENSKPKRTFRICNIGAINSVDMSSFLLSVDTVLGEMGVKNEP